MSMPLPPYAPQIKETLRELQDQTISYVLAALYGLGILSMLGSTQLSSQFQGAMLGLLLLAVVGAAWLLRIHSYMAAAVTLIVGCFAAVALVLHLRQDGQAVGLLALPVGLTLLLINKRTGIAVAVLCSVFLFLVARTTPGLESSLLVIALVQIWGMVGLLWLTSHSLVTTMVWFRTSYERSQTLLEQAR